MLFNTLLACMNHNAVKRRLFAYRWFSLAIGSLASFLWDKGKRCRPRTDTADQVLHCLLTEQSIQFAINCNGNTTQQPLKLKWTGPIDKNFIRTGVPHGSVSTFY